jgi:hypothetical protein
MSANEARRRLTYNSCSLYGAKMSEAITTNVVNGVAVTIIECDRACQNFAQTECITINL